MYDYILAVCAAAMLLMGVMLLVTPKSGVKKGNAITAEVLKKNRISGAILTTCGVVAGVIFFLTRS